MTLPMRTGQRRSILCAAATGTLLPVRWLLPLLLPLRALAAEWNASAFEATNLDEAFSKSGVKAPTESEDILIRAPDIAENGAAVPVEITSKLPETRSITLYSEKNPQPMIGTFEFGEGVEPYVSTRVKLGDTSNLYAVVRAGGRDYMASKEIKVTIGGCG